MALMPSRIRISIRRGYTTVELLYAMALIVFVMSIVSQSFANGLETFRNLKAVGDLDEKLRAAAVNLREDLAAAHFGTDEYVRDSVRAKAADPVRAGELRAAYERICVNAADIDVRLREVERQTVNPPAKRVLRRILDDLEIMKAGALRMVWLFTLVERNGKWP